MRPDLSVIIVEWNTRDLLRDCLTSVCARHAIRTEVIVIDNASSDGSAEMVAAEFPQVTLIRNGENRGFAAATNQGLAESRGRHFLLLNSDTRVLGSVLEASVRYLDAHPDVGAMGCRVLNPDGTVQRTCSGWPRLTDLVFMATGLWKLPRPRRLGRYLMTQWSRDTEREVEVISGCYLLIRAAVVAEVGPLDEAFFFFGEETDWCRRIRAAGWRLMFAPVGEIVHHGSASARRLSHRRDLMLTQATVRLHRKHGGPGAGHAAWAILFAFNLSRALMWSVRWRHSGRAQHFRGVVAGMLRPSRRT